MTTKCFINCEIGLDGEGEASIYRIKNITPEPLYRVFTLDNIPTGEIDYGKTINISIQSVFFVRK